MRIYVASSWRNENQPGVVAGLRAAGNDVYDFRHPAPDNEGFHWSEIDPAWKSWTPDQFREALGHPIAIDGFARDWAAMQRADACVLVLPCGRSAHLELGWFVGQGRPTIVLMLEPQEPELMYRMVTAVATSLTAVVHILNQMSSRPRQGIDGGEEASP